MPWGLLKLPPWVWELLVLNAPSQNLVFWLWETWGTWSGCSPSRAPSRGSINRRPQQWAHADIQLRLAFTWPQLQPMNVWSQPRERPWGAPLSWAQSIQEPWELGGVVVWMWDESRGGSRPVTMIRQHGCSGRIYVTSCMCLQGLKDNYQIKIMVVVSGQWLQGILPSFFTTRICDFYHYI